MESANRTWMPLHLERLTGGPPSRLKGRGQVQPGCRNFPARRGCRTRGHGPSRRRGNGFAEEVAGNVQKREAPTLFWDRGKIRFDEYLDGLVAVINLDTNRCVAKVHLMASSVLPSNDGVRHRPHSKSKAGRLSTARPARRRLWMLAPEFARSRP